MSPHPHSRYTILRKIADGGTAEIFLAKQSGAQGFEKMVVLKRIFNSFYSDPQFRHMLVDEAHIAMSLYHSNIVQVLDLGEANGRHFLALELVDGWTLDEILKRSKAASVPFPPALALYVTAEVCRALAYAHSKTREGKPLGIVHRDVSPHNVLMSEHGEVKLTDFGIAKAQNKQEKSVGNMIKGKIAFMSPEQASGHDLDARSDLFSLGTILYLMIARRPPFDAATDYETLMQVRSGDFVPPETVRPGLNPEIYRVMRKAMGKTAEERYQRADEMLVDVEQVMRIAFRAVGQTELARWLVDLGAKDGVPPLTRAPLPPVSDTVVMDRPPVEEELDTGVELDLDGADAILLTSPQIDAPAGAPPSPQVPPPLPRNSQAHVTSLRPVPFWKEGPARKTAVRIGAVALLLLIAVAGVEVLHLRARTTRGAAVPGGAGLAPVARATEPQTAAAPGAPAPHASDPIAATTPAPGVVATVAPAPGVVAPQASPAAAADTARASSEALAARTKVNEAPPEPPAAAPGEEPEPADQPDEKTDDKPGGDGTGDGVKSLAKRQSVAHQMSVAIKSDPPGSQISTRHHSFGATPISLKLRAGNVYELTFTKAGYLPSTKTYKITTATKGIRVALKKAPPAPRPAPTAESPPPDSKKSWWKLHFSR